MVTAKYKTFRVKGRWFMLGDSRWLLLTLASTKLTGQEAIPEEYLKDIKDI